MSTVTKEMNEAALRETLELFPSLNESELGEFFIECTPFPMVPVAACMLGVRELAQRSGRDWKKARDLVYADMDAAMANNQAEARAAQPTNHE